MTKPLDLLGGAERHVARPRGFAWTAFVIAPSISNLIEPPANPNVIVMCEAGGMVPQLARLGFGQGDQPLRCGQHGQDRSRGKGSERAGSIVGGAEGPRLPQQM